MGTVEVSGWVHMEGKLVDSYTLMAGPNKKWQMTLCERVAHVDSLLTKNPHKVTCPACLKRMNNG